MRKKLKIFQFMASEKYGGAEKVCVDLSNEMSKTHFVTVLALRKTEYLSRFSSEVEIIELKSHPTRNNPFLLLEIYRNIRILQPDIVHTHGGKAAILIHRLNFLMRLNHLATKHNGRKGRIFNKLQYVTAVSQDAVESVKSKNKINIKRIYNGIEPRPVEKKLQHSIFKIAAIGRLDKIKGFDLLIKELSSVRFPFHLIIAGDGLEMGHLQKTVDDLKMRDRVSFVGFYNEIPELMASTHLIVMPSHSEGFPQVMVEALFYGNVFISTPVGGAVEVLPEMFLTDHNGLGSKITDVYQNYSHYCKKFESLKKEKAGNFVLSTIASEYERYYYEILS